MLLKFFHYIYIIAFTQFFIGNMDIDNDIKDADGKTFFYQMKYDSESARFEDPLPDPECPKQISHRFCPSCIRLAMSTQRDIPKVRI